VLVDLQEMLSQALAYNRSNQYPEAI
jgi:hypothetical protein